MSVCDAALIGRQANAGVTDRPCSMAHTRYLSPPPSLVATATALALAALTHRHIALAKPVFLRLLRDELGVRTAVRLEEDVPEDEVYTSHHHTHGRESAKRNETARQSRYITSRSRPPRQRPNGSDDSVSLCADAPRGHDQQSLPHPLSNSINECLNACRSMSLPDAHDDSRGGLAARRSERRPTRTHGSQKSWMVRRRNPTNSPLAVSTKSAALCSTFTSGRWCSVKPENIV